MHSTNFMDPMDFIKSMDFIDSMNFMGSMDCIDSCEFHDLNGFHGFHSLVFLYVLTCVCRSQVAFKPDGPSVPISPLRQINLREIEVDSKQEIRRKRKTESERE